jgi:hypothetical protein
MPAALMGSYHLSEGKSGVAGPEPTLTPPTGLARQLTRAPP